ncbi:hypothetical protein C4D60_Mb07t23300 [Musa balbisiana]|uniref:Uncharacterized protein n=1 Tax=Musa balbisiana TaxID=52838 RepID=A0A4S8JHN4_MUSBA|nr:hypothetical protein C4D60_Mb07t23300 [Musa balbisiana]
MLMKKGKRSAMESSPPSTYYPVSQEAKTRFRHQSLLQDYENLLKETEAKRRKLQKADQKKLKLLAEINEKSVVAINIHSIGEGLDEQEVSLGPAKADKLRKNLMDCDDVANDLKPLICRDVGRGSNRVVKRKITWQDQVALRV